MKSDDCSAAEDVSVEESAASERRRPYLRREDVSLRAKLLQDGCPELAIRICNLSPGGFMAECLRPPAPGCQVVLSLPGAGYIPAEVRWAGSFKMGGLFHMELGARELGMAADDVGERS